jgi:glycerophosphoryl diester phosphodiesterase
MFPHVRLSWCLVFLLITAFSLPAEVLSIAHRGNSLFAPENTLTAFAAAQGKADWVETDARLTSDGQLVIMHDATVDRTTDGTGAIAGKTLAELQLLDAGSWFASSFMGQRIPTLEDMITNTIPHAIPLIEHKSGSAAAYVNEFERLNVVTNIVLQSFDWNFLSAVHALAPGLKLCALGSGTLDATVLAAITNCGARTVAWEKSTVTANVLSLVHSWGLRLFVWTVDGPQIQNFIALGVDGIISNDPGLVKQLQQTNSSDSAELADRLVSYWRLDDGLTDAFTNTVADGTGTNFGTLVRNDGASHWFDSSVAKFGGCVKLEGSNAFVTLPQTASLDINTNALTIATWLRLQNLPSQMAANFGAIFDSTTDCYVLYQDKATKELRFKITDANGHAARPGIPEAFLPTNQWIHIAATYSGAVGPVSGQATIYLNGQPSDVHSGNDSSSLVGLTGNVKSGQLAAMGREGPTGASFFTGFMDDVAIWKRALAPGEIQNLFRRGLAGESLGDLLRQPTTLIQWISAQKNVSGAVVELRFKNFGAWQSFRLLRADRLSGPFLAVAGITPVALGGGEYRFDYPLAASAAEYFRVEGW